MEEFTVQLRTPYEILRDIPGEAPKGISFVTTELLKNKHQNPRRSMPLWNSKWNFALLTEELQHILSVKLLEEYQVKFQGKFPVKYLEELPKERETRESSSEVPGGILKGVPYVTTKFLKIKPQNPRRITCPSSTQVVLVVTILI